MNDYTYYYVWQPKNKKEVSFKVYCVQSIAIIKAILYYKLNHIRLRYYTYYFQLNKLMVLNFLKLEYYLRSVNSKPIILFIV